MSSSWRFIITFDQVHQRVMATHNINRIMQQRALTYLRTVLNNSSASFRNGQWESIETLLNRNRVLVVQRTGWGKSMVYFLATKLLREQGAGPTLLISPLLSLMRNQIEAAERIGITARTINSSNNEEWEEIHDELSANQVDVLIISPERLANDNFRQNVLSSMTSDIGLFVVDEAHCISDWGHDFRPDYRRIVRVLQAIPPNVPVLATTATANDRVVSDIQSQLGQSIQLHRGSLVRKSLKLQNITMPSPAARMAWLAGIIPQLPGSGIIYTLTQRDAERVTGWLQTKGIRASAYHAGLASDPENSAMNREILEQQLLNNEVKVLVATVALGMGFDKPDLGFVIHFQRPATVVHYYQQVGRAGRAVDEAYGILLHGEEDDEIADYFIRSAFPPQNHVEDIIQALDQSEAGLSVPEMQKELNLRKSQIDKTLKFLNVESPSPIVKIKTKWQAAAASSSYEIDREYVDGITAIRRSEQQQMRDYMNHSDCLMSFLQQALDDPSADDCGQCKSCNPSLLLDDSYDDILANEASLFLRRSYQSLQPRKRWPVKNLFQLTPLEGSKISEDLQAEEGRALSLWRDAGWGQLVASGKYQAEHFSDELISACVEMLKVWSPYPDPKWVTCIPSLKRPELVPGFAKRLADALDLPFMPCIVKVRQNREQKEMENSYQQVKNLDGVFEIRGQIRNEACLLIDDTVDSGWTFTVASALLREAGCSAVYPLALALTSHRSN